MSPTVFVLFCVLLSTESIFICIGNAFTIFVFWQKRLSLQRTYYLLLNLTVADLLVGVVELISLATRSVPFLFTVPDYDMNTYHYSFLFSSLIILFSWCSVFSLAVISVERVYAVLCPLRHRTLNSRVYVGGIVLVWVAAIFAAALFMLPLFEVVDVRFSTVAINLTLLLSLSVICTSYILMRSRLSRGVPIFDSQIRRNMARNIKLSKTLLIIISLSLILLAPGCTVVHCYLCVSKVYFGSRQSYVDSNSFTYCQLSYHPCSVYIQNVRFSTVAINLTLLLSLSVICTSYILMRSMRIITYAFKEALRKLFRARGHVGSVQVYS